MAPGKKQKKSKSKKSKKDSPGLSHIASQLVPTAVFAAVPRTPTNLSRTWPKRSPSPLAQAISEAGNVGRIVLGDLSKRPPAALPDEHAESTREETASNFDERGGDFENEVGYESVQSIGGKRFDKTTKFYNASKKGNSSMEREEEEPSPEASEHFYHILDHENGQIVEPVYSTVNKKKKAAAKASGEEGEKRESLSEDSSDELTDVTSHDESTTVHETSGRRSVSFSDKDDESQSRHQRKSMKGRSTGNDSPDGPQSQGKKSSIKRKTPDTIQEVTEGVADKDRPPSLPPYIGDTSPQPPERSKRKGRKTSPDVSDGILPSTPEGSLEQRLTDEQRRALKIVERLGFEGVSEKLDLSDLSQDEDGYMSPDVPKSPVNYHGSHLGFPLSPSPRETPQNTLTDEQKKGLKVVEELGFDGVSEKLGISSLSEDGQSFALPRVPKNSIDFHGRTSFEQEQFGDTLTESSIPVSEARLHETNLSLNQSFADHEGFQSQEIPQHSLNNQPQPGYHGDEWEGFQRQARKANKVSSFVQMLNEQAEQRGEDSSSHRRVQLAGSKNISSSLPPTNGQDINRGGFDPALMQRLEEARQANETSFLERQGQLKSLVEQQQALYQQQVEQQKIQQQQQQEVVRQQWKLQEQLRALEKVQQEFAENVDVSPSSLHAVSESDVQFQKELVRQQQQFLEQQKDQLRQSQAQQAEVLKQQERLCNQINLLEEQQKQLQSSVHLLGPAGEDLAEIKQQEQQIMNLLNEQRQQESEYQRLHVLQQQRLDEQTSSFTQERKALEQHQEMLQQKIREQEAKSRQLEEQLMDMARKHADSEARLKKKISMEAESPQVERKERREEREASDVNTAGYDNKERRRHPGREATSREEKNSGKKITSQPAERRDRRSGRNELGMRSGNTDVSYEEKERRHEERDYSRSKGQRFKQKRTDSDLSLNSDSVEETQARMQRDESAVTYYKEREESHRGKRGKSGSSRRREGGESHFGDQGGREEGNSPARRSSAVVSDRRQTKESDLDYLSKGRIELLEAEKAALMELNTSQQEENRALKQLALSLQKGSGISSVVLQQQIKELHQEQKVLRNTVHRLNVELSRYQAKYRPVSFEEVEGFALPQKKEAAPWLVNTKFLAPLFLAYDDRLKEKEQMIKTYDEELNAFKARVMEVVKENQQLHMSLNKASPESLDPDEWQQLQEQAKLVVEENALLMEQQEILARKMKELQRIHGQEVSKLSKRISSQESVQRSLETELKDMRRSHSNLLRKYEALVTDEENKISLQEHLKIMDECRRVLEEFKAKTRSEAEDSNTRVQAIHKEKSNLAVKLADSEARIAQLERELDAYQKSLKKSERKFLFLQRKLEHIQERELTAQETLSQVLTVAEKTAAERDNYVEFAKSQKVEQEKAVTKILVGSQNIKGLEEKLQEYRRKASDKVAAVTGRLREREKEINKLREQHETEVNNLRALVRQKQRQLELVIGENRNVEKELELVWRTAAADNKRMKDTVKQKGAMFDSDSDPNGHLSSEEGEAT